MLDSAVFVVPVGYNPILSLDSLLEDEDGQRTGFDVVDETAIPPIDLIAEAELRKEIGAFLGSLKPRDQEILKRIFWQDQTQTEVAKQLGVSKMAISKTIKQICERGRKALAHHHHFALGS